MDWERVERLIGTSNLEMLTQKRVGIIGLGSGGGFVAQALAMSGIGHFVLVDNDALEQGNVVRHVADIRDVGKNKAQAVADLMKLRNPKIDVAVFAGRIEDHLEALDNLDILVVGVDNENVKYIINEIALQRGLTALYAGVYERGEGGDVVVIRPYDGPCYACWAQELREGITISRGDDGELDYGMIGDTGTLEAEPGLWIHVAKVAAIQADLTLNELLKGTSINEEMPGNTLILANNSLEILEGQINAPHTAIWVDIERDSECLVCGERMRAAQNLASADNEGVSLDDIIGDMGMGIEMMEEDRSQQATRSDDNE